MAEVYNYGLCPQPEDVTLQGLGIDYTYNKNVLDLLKANNLDALRGYIAPTSQAYFARTAHFVENHDEPRAAAALGGAPQAFAGAAIISTLPGLRLYFKGEFQVHGVCSVGTAVAQIAGPSSGVLMLLSCCSGWWHWAIACARRQ